MLNGDVDAQTSKAMKTYSIGAINWSRSCEENVAGTFNMQIIKLCCGCENSWLKNQ
jgi:hypothetical protein